MTRRISRRLAGAVVALGLLALAFGRPALAVVYWDGNASTANNLSENSQSTAMDWFNEGNWDNGITSAPLASWTAGESAVFGGPGSAQTIDVTAPLTVGDLTFGSGGNGAGTSGTAYTIAGGTIALSNGTITANTDTKISSILAGGASTLTKAGDGMLTLTGANTYTGATTISAGTLRLGDGTTQPTINSSTYNIAPGATLKIQYNTSGSAAQTWSKYTGAGTLTLASGKTFDTGWANINLNSAAAGWTGTLRIEGGRAYTTSALSANNYGLGGTTAVIITPGGHLGMWEGGTYAQSFTIAGTGYGEGGYEAAIRMGNSGVTSTITGSVTLAGNTTLGAVGTGVITLGIGENTVSNLTLGTSSMGGTMELRGANTYTGTTRVAYGTLVIGSTAGASSASIYGGNIVNQLTIDAGKRVRFASTGVPHTISGTVGGAGVIEVSGTSAIGATLNVVAGANITPGQLVVGDSGIGNYVQTGGTVSTSTAYELWVANNAGGSGSTITVTGGTLNLGTGTAYLGVRGSYTFTIDGNADVRMGTMQLGHTSGTTNNPTGRIVNLQGSAGSSTLRVGAINLVSGTANINFDGGKLRATANFNPTPSIVTTVKFGGAHIDTAGFNVGIGSPLLHDGGLGGIPDGGLTKLNGGTLTLTAAPTYTGPTTVAGGALVMPETSSTSSIAVNDTAALTITGYTGATIGGAAPIAALTLGSTPGAGGATLAFRNFAGSTSVPLIATQSFTTNAAGGGATLNVTGGFTGTGTFPLISYSDPAIAGNGFAALALAVPRNVTATLQNPANAVNLNVTAYTPTTWKGNNPDNVWDVNTTANWMFAGSPGNYLDGDIVLFEDTQPAGAGAVSVALNTTVAPAGVNVAGSRDYTIAGSGGIGGTGTLRKTGTGALTLATANTYSGATLIHDGALNLAGSLTGSEAILVGGSAVLSQGPASVIAGLTSITHASTGTSTLSGNNTFTGPVTVGAGTLKVGHANALGATGAASGTTVAAGGALDLNGIALAAETIVLNGAGPSGGGALINSSSTPASTGAPITLAAAASIGGAGNMTLSGDIAGSSLLTKVGAGIVTFSTRKSYTGNTQIDGGILDLTGGGGSVGTINGTVTVNAGGTLRLTGGDVTGYETATRLHTLNLVGGSLYVNTTSNQTLGAPRST